jgi:DNA (cytosine-5)-methyltransferase 1
MGWEAAFFSEIEKFPCAVLEHRYPDVPLHGDFTTIKENEYGKIDLLVGGTPCQSFSVAGLRGGLDDDRGNLALEFCRLAQREQPRWIVWENVPGVLSSNGGRDFGSILGALEELGYGLAYRVLDAQYFGVAQRRLETGDLPQRFSLSATACQGILRRAEKRGKKLPTRLQRALEAVAATDGHDLI